MTTTRPKLAALQLKLAMKEGYWLMCVDNGWPEEGDAYIAFCEASEAIRRLFRVGEGS